LNNKIKITKVKETNHILAFHHTRPSWTLHIVVVPKVHIPNLLELKEIDLIKEVFEVLREIIIELKLNETNYKIVTNGGTFQDSKHLHFHLLSGKPINKTI